MFHCVQADKIGYRVGFTCALLSPPTFVLFVYFVVTLPESLDSARDSQLE